VVLGNSMEVCQRNADASERRPYQRIMNDLRILKVGTAVPSRPFVGIGDVSEFRYSGFDQYVDILSAVGAT
jgi:hypothetical protein